MFYDRKSNKYVNLFTKVVAVIMSVIIFCLLTGAVIDEKTKKVTLVMVDAFTDSERASKLITRQDFVGEFLQENKIEVGEYDRVNVLLEDELLDDSEIVIRKGRMITLNIDGRMEIITSTHKTIKEAFVEAGVVVSDSDIVEPAIDSEIVQGMEITVVRVKNSEVTIDTDIPFKTHEVSDSSLEKGKKKVKVKGVNGTKRTVYSVTTQDGVETQRVLLSEEIVKEPVDQVVHVGTKPKNKSKKSVVTNAGNTLNYSKKLTVTATAYTAPSGKRTASGRVAQYGVIAVDPNVIPIGTKLYVESTDDGKSWQYGYCVAGDTGGAIKGNKIDLYFGSKNECLQFGRKSAIVYVLE